MSIQYKKFPQGAIDDASPSATEFDTDLSSAVDDIYVGYTIVLFGAAETEQVSVVSDYDGTNKTISVSPALPVTPSNGDGFFLLPWGLGGGGPTANVNVVSIASGAIDDDALAADTDVYTAKLWLQIDDANTYDRYTVAWFKNGVPVTSGITNPAIQVVQRSDGNDLVGSTSMTQIGSTGRYKYDENSNRISSGAGYLVLVSATIDGSTRNWCEIVGRDG
jgi:hypothetical protein